MTHACGRDTVPNPGNGRRSGSQQLGWLNSSGQTLCACSAHSRYGQARGTALLAIATEAEPYLYRSRKPTENPLTATNTMRICTMERDPSMLPPTPCDSYACLPPFRYDLRITIVPASCRKQESGNCCTRPRFTCAAMRPRRPGPLSCHSYYGASRQLGLLRSTSRAWCQGPLVAYSRCEPTASS